MNKEDIKLENSWKQAMLKEFDMPYMSDLRRFLVAEKKANKRIYPRGNEIFSAFNFTPLELVKVVIIGQDPYHGVGQAHGLAFSVPDGIQIPPSLLNIFQEIDEEFETNVLRSRSKNGCLLHWAEQGVLLLNSVLTVEEGRAGSHRGRGWEVFTDCVVRVLDKSSSPLVFMLWGAYAQKKAAFVDRERHCILVAPHPSPLSAHRGFFGCGHFKKANQFLASKGFDAIDWLGVTA